MPCRKQNVPIECHICYKKFTKPQGLKTHKISTMHNKEDQKFKCDICMKGFAVWKNFKKLVRNGHVQDRINVCFVQQKCHLEGPLQDISQEVIRKISNVTFVKNPLDL